jgi:hypothetical protein
MADAADLIACQCERLLNEVSGMRADMNVLIAAFRRLEASQAALLQELRAIRHDQEASQ